MSKSLNRVSFDTPSDSNRDSFTRFFDLTRQMLHLSAETPLTATLELLEIQPHLEKALSFDSYSPPSGIQAPFSPPPLNPSENELIKEIEELDSVLTDAQSRLSKAEMHLLELSSRKSISKEALGPSIRSRTEARAETSDASSKSNRKFQGADEDQISKLLREERKSMKILGEMVSTGVTKEKLGQAWGVAEQGCQAGLALSNLSRPAGEGFDKSEGSVIEREERSLFRKLMLQRRIVSVLEVLAKFK